MLALSAGALGLAAPARAAGAASPYDGRWTVDEDKPVFTSRGRLYKTIDVAPCGGNFCAVSVDDAGKCGPLLFRIPAAAAMTARINGRGKWGGGQKNVVLYSYGEDASARGFELYVGDGYNFGGRSGNMPKYHAEYRKLGAARCVARKA